MSKRERAIALIEECRQIHLDWARHIARNPQWAQVKVKRSQSAGSRTYHRKWVKRYDLVLEVLCG